MNAQQQEEKKSINTILNDAVDTYMNGADSFATLQQLGAIGRAQLLIIELLDEIAGKLDEVEK